MRSHSQSVKIVLIEDSEDDAFFFRNNLRKTGVPNQLTHLIDGGEAIDYFTSLKLKDIEDRPEIIFLDLKLPKYSGFEILEKINATNFQPPLRITVLSGSDLPSDIAMARELGASDYVVKPISPDELKRRLSNSSSSAQKEQSSRLTRQD